MDMDNSVVILEGGAIRGLNGNGKYNNKIGERDKFHGSKQ